MLFFDFFLKFFEIEVIKGKRKIMYFEDKNGFKYYIL